MKFIVILFILTSTALFGQQPEWIATGIVDSAISVSGGQNGIWAATQNNGIQFLNTNNGRVTIYNTDNTPFVTNDFRCVLAVNDKVYAGTFDKGLYILENNNWIYLDTINSPLPGMSISDFCSYDENTMYVATDKGLAKIENDTWEIFDSLNSGISANKLTCLYKDANSVLWIGSRYHGVTTLQDNIFTNYNFDNAGINDNWIRAVCGDANGYMYIADYFGVNKYDVINDDWIFVYNTFTAPMTSERVNKIGFQENGTMWFATHIGVTSADIDNNWSQFYSDNSGLPHNTCDGLFIDADDRVWVACYGGVAVFADKNSLPEFETNLIIYPNPCKTTITIEAPGFEQYMIFDMMGNQLISTANFSETFGNRLSVLDVTSLPSGVYLISAQNAETIVSKAFVKL
ncbi:MAG: T9SS type A sorting domain-containing protein [Chitinophagales bacterium]